MGKIRLWVGIAICSISALATNVSAVQNISLSIVPVGSTTVNGNQLVTVEVFISAADQAQDLRGTQVDLPCSLTGGMAGTVTTGNETPVNDPDSRVLVNTATGSTGGIPFMFPGGLAPVNQSNCRAAGTITIGGTFDTLPAGQTRYLATYIYRVSRCAAGEFGLNFESFNNPPTISDQTRVLAPDGPDADLNDEPVPFKQVLSSLRVAAQQCCDGGTCIGDLNPTCCADMGGTSNAGRSCETDGCPCTMASECDDNNPCTDDSCVDLVCRNVNNTAPCDDGMFCTNPDVCMGGVCMPGPARVCPEPGGDPDFDICSEALDACVECLGPGDCGDGNTCTDDICNPSGECNNPNNTAACETDNNPCTNDVCAGGSCTHPFNTNSCDDGIFCTRTSQCQMGVCVGTAPRVCPTSGHICCPIQDACLECCEPSDCDDDNECTMDACNITGAPPVADCVNTPVTGPCEDGMFCTAGDFCMDGECMSGTDSPCMEGEDCVEEGGGDCIACLIPEDCDDDNVCTQDDCVDGACVYVNEGAGTVCGNPEVGPCDNRDTCDGAGNCQSNPKPNGTDCDDDLFCNGDDSCLDGVCAHTGNPCMTPTPNCNEVTDMCLAGLPCPGGVGDCPPDADANPCTSPACVGGFCDNVPNSNTCSDGNACTTNDVCSGGVCVGGPAPNCNDGNACTVDSCDPASGCVNSASAANGMACGSGADSDCDNPDTCLNGTCQPNREPNGTGCPDDGNQCTTDVCDGNGNCTHPNRTNGTACGDSANTDCDNPDTCINGTCQPNREPNGTACPDDGNPCTSDTCDGAGVCTHPNRTNGTACGSSANTDCDNPDTCINGACQANLEPAGTGCIDDGNQCTSDTCDGAGVCTHPARPAGTACGTTANTDCDNPDSCNASGVCLLNNEPNGTPCTDDSNTCTTDVCNNGLCAHAPVGVGVPCGDPTDNACTNPDACNASGVCVANHEPNGTSCSDGFSCNGAETCQSGACADGADLNCDDGNICTVDSCDEATGCVNTPIPDCVVALGDRANISVKGSLLIYSKVEIKWDLVLKEEGSVVSDGPYHRVAQDTFFTLTNDYPGAVNVQLYFVNGDAPTPAVCEIGCQVAFGDRCREVPGCVTERAHPGWNWVDCQFRLTSNQPTYWSALTGQPVGCQPFWVLDPGDPPGRPDPDGAPGARILRGYVLGWAVDPNGREIRWNHLSGNAAVVNYTRHSAWEYNAYAFQAISGDHGSAPDGDSGQLLLDGIEYDECFNRLLFDFYATGGGVFGGLLDTDITLHPVSADLRQETDGPITTKAVFDIWNEDETRFSGTERCITCWDQTLASNYGSPNHFRLEVLGTRKGKARVDGIASQRCGPFSVDAAMLGLTVKLIDFGLIGVPSGRIVPHAESALTMVGIGNETGVILYDVISGSEEVTQPLLETSDGKTVEHAIPVPRK
jgi:hypothetical protein